MRGTLSLYPAAAGFTAPADFFGSARHSPAPTTARAPTTSSPDANPCVTSFSLPVIVGPRKPPRLPIIVIIATPPAAACPPSTRVGSAQNGPIMDQWVLAGVFMLNQLGVYTVTIFMPDILGTFLHADAAVDAAKDQPFRCDSVPGGCDFYGHHRLVKRPHG